MITWKLWRALKYPPHANRLFQLTVATHALSEAPFPTLALLIALIFLPLMVFTSQMIVSIFSSLLLVSIPILAILQVFTGSYYGLLWSVRTASTIAQIRRRAIYETLCLLPDGPMGVNWVICTACLYGNGKYREFDSTYTWPIRMLIIFGLSVYFSPALPQDQIWTLLAIVFNMALFVLWFRIDDIQSIVLACITGMMIPTYTKQKFEVQMSTVSLYLFIQLPIYALTIALAIYIFPALFRSAELNGWFGSVSIPVFSVAAMVLIREGVISMLWKRLLFRLEIHSQDNVSASCIMKRPA